MHKVSAIKAAFFKRENIVDWIIPDVKDYDPQDSAIKTSLVRLMGTVYEENLRGSVQTKDLQSLNAEVARRLSEIIANNKEVARKAPESTGTKSEAPKNFVIRVSSGARDVFSYPHSYQFRTYLTGTNNAFGMEYAGSMPTLRNVSKIEVIGAIAPNLSLLNPHAFVEPMLCVKIVEVDTLTSATFPNGNNILAELRFEFDAANPQRLIHAKKIDNYFPRIYDPTGKLNNLSQFTISMCTHDGTLLEGIPQDSYVIASGAGGGNTLTITTTVPHAIVVGEKVIIRKYDSGTLDDATINRPFGHVVTAITSNTFTVATNSAGAGNGGYVLRANLQFQVTLRFTTKA